MVMYTPSMQVCKYAICFTFRILCKQTSFAALFIVLIFSEVLLHSLMLHACNIQAQWKNVHAPTMQQLPSVQVSESMHIMFFVVLNSLLRTSMLQNSPYTLNVSLIPVCARYKSSKYTTCALLFAQVCECAQSISDLSKPCSGSKAVKNCRKHSETLQKKLSEKLQKTK